MRIHRDLRICRYATSYPDCMTTVIPTRFTAAQKQTLDRLVAKGASGTAQK